MPFHVDSTIDSLVDFFSAISLKRESVGIAIGGERWFPFSAGVGGRDGQAFQHGFAGTRDGRDRKRDVDRRESGRREASRPAAGKPRVSVLDPLAVFIGRLIDVTPDITLEEIAARLDAERAT